MDKQVGVNIFKNELSNRTSTDRFHLSSEIQAENNKQKNNSSVQTEVYIKTEPYEVDIELPVAAGTSHDICSNDDIKSEIFEPLIQIECTDLKIEELEDPLHIINQIKVENEDSLQCDSENETEDEEFLLTTNVKLGSPQNEGSNIKNEKNTFNKLTKKNPSHKCHICGKLFEYKSLLDYHMLFHSGQKPHVCDVCKKGFKRTSHLNAHKKLHTGVKLFSCDVCGYQCYQKSNLNIHKRLHTGIKPYTCDLCNKSFVERKSLTRHERVHTGIKPYICDICNKGFKQLGSFTYHRRVHAGIKPYTCEFCNKAFTAKETLKMHIRVHTGEKPHSCEICNKSFTRKQFLDHHKCKPNKP